MGYQDVPVDDGEAAAHLLGQNTKEKPRIRGMVKAFIVGVSLVNLILLLILASFMRTYESCRRDQINVAYSPARSTLRNEIRVFDSGFDEGRTIYQGPPSEANEAAWDDLYNTIGVLRINENEASKLVNKTLPIPGDPGHYAISLSVFHQLHCLNMIRKAYWAKSSGAMEMTDMPHHEEMMDPMHIDHCIDTIRQYMMCNPDVTATTWVWDAGEQKSKAVADVAHTCRSFDDVKSWAMERRMRVPFQRDVHVMGS